jgi:hypothetical protein
VAINVIVELKASPGKRAELRDWGLCLEKFSKLGADVALTVSSAFRRQ